MGLLNTISRGLWSVTILMGILYRNRWNFLQSKSPAKASSSIWLYRFSGSVRLRLAYCPTCQHCSPGFLCVRVAANPIGYPSMCSSCSAWGSKYAWTVSLLSMPFKCFRVFMLPFEFSFTVFSGCFLILAGFHES